MHYIICENCHGYYKLKKGESLDDFISCQCGGKLKFIDNDKRVNDVNKGKQKLKMFTRLSYSYIVIFIISVIAVLYIAYFGLNTLISYNRFFFISIILITLLALRYILKKSNTKNPVITSLFDISIYLVTPLLIIFISIIIYSAITD